MLPSVISQYCILFKETILRTPEEHFQADFAESNWCIRTKSTWIPKAPEWVFFYAGFYSIGYVWSAPPPPPSPIIMEEKSILK